MVKMKVICCLHLPLPGKWLNVRQPDPICVIWDSGDSGTALVVSFFHMLWIIEARVRE